VAGRQIRWASLGRVAAIAAAVLAAIVSLPALLGGERPPPVPADVGLAPPAVAEPVAPAVMPAETSQPVANPEHLQPKGKNRLRKRDANTGRREQPRRDLRSPHRKHRNEGGEQVARAPAPAPTYVPAPVYSPPPPGEFRFER